MAVDYVLSTRPIPFQDPLRSGSIPVFLVRRDAPSLSYDTALAELPLTIRVEHDRRERLLLVEVPTCGPDDVDEPARPAPPADIDIDLPGEDESGDADTLVELPLDGDAGDTLRMPL